MQLLLVHNLFFGVVVILCTWSVVLFCRHMYFARLTVFVFKSLQFFVFGIKKNIVDVNNFNVRICFLHCWHCFFCLIIFYFFWTNKNISDVSICNVSSVKKHLCSFLKKCWHAYMQCRQHFFGRWAYEGPNHPFGFMSAVKFLSRSIVFWAYAVMFSVFFSCPLRCWLLSHLFVLFSLLSSPFLSSPLWSTPLFCCVVVLLSCCCVVFVVGLFCFCCYLVVALSLLSKARTKGST